jgi:hypothetical protein
MYRPNRVMMPMRSVDAAELVHGEMFLFISFITKASKFVSVYTVRRAISCVAV